MQHPSHIIQANDKLSLLKTDKKVFERTGTELSFSSKYQKMLSIYKKLLAERLYLAILEYLLDDESREVVLSDFISFFMKNNL